MEAVLQAGEGGPLNFIVKVFDVMLQASLHTFQVLTKRHDRLGHAAVVSYACFTDCRHPPSASSIHLDVTRARSWG